MEIKKLYPTVYCFNCARVLNALRNHLLSEGGRDIYPPPLEPVLYQLEERETGRRADTMVYSYVHMNVQDMEVYVQIDRNMFFPDHYHIRMAKSKYNPKLKELPKEEWQTEALLDAELEDNEVVEIAQRMLKAMRHK